MKIALVIGHQQNNQGAYGSEGIGEWEYNNSLIQDILPSLDYENVLITTRDPNISGYGNQMRDLHKRIDQWGADVSIEFHFNSFSNSSAQGHEVLYCSEGGKKLAKLLNDELDKNLPTSNRGIKRVSGNDRGAGFCCRGRSKALILEPYFAAHQNKFVKGGELYEPLKKAIITFIQNL